MKLNDFGGGLSTRLDPTLIQPNEAIEFSNIDNAKGNLTSIKSYTSLNQAIYRYFYLYGSTWYSSSNERDYLEYRDKLYWTEKEDYPKKVVNGNTKLLGIEAPTVALTAAVGAAGTIVTVDPTTVQYMYTYYDSSEGIESAPSPLSNELSLPINKKVDLSGFATSTNSYVDTIRLYRIGADATDFTLLVELPIATSTYADNIKTIDAIGGILDTYLNQAPLIGLRFLTEAYGIMFGAVGNSLKYSIIGKPDAWPTINTIPISSDITGLAAIPDGIIIFTLTKSYLLLGTSSDNFRLVLFSGEHGCIKHSTIKVVNNTLSWASYDGICVQAAGTIKVITKDKFGGINFVPISATVYSEEYYLILEDGTTFIMDTRFSVPVYKFIKFPLINIYNIGNFNNILYAVINDDSLDTNTVSLATMFTGAQAIFNYTSGRLTDGDATITKLYNNIYVRANGRFTIDILIDAVKIHKEELIGDEIFDITVPQEKQRGSDIQFVINGTGTIKEIEYKIVGRANGR